ncbi:TetR/AcrR family transcriptional regulator [Mycolicibacillus parakoreensis]|uniref:TetR/AcrR family transcriptional regulator n=1 Tax=Mycolicibacillus parakoreensis TaxID=1069221 RepID=A0ABY3U5V3_9MYCO|nr:TetR family transcriptional regulator [Mycolicibacillus parakoreensis]MCV7314167.1 TetR/AcrR family transcriptional regulator [Mycolicibacillus parakoreensis]ULN52887.1 TetR/AcrR family transcriptional regulator [Mycolicibacillus parakoreensis]
MVGVEATGGDGARSPDRILLVVVDLLETDGYDAVQLREVARRARTSLATIYKRYATRDELILAALEAWMEEHRYSAVPRGPREPDESLYTALMRLLRTIFEPWERHPGMLKAYFRARAAPGGQQLVRRGLDVVVPAGMEALAGVDAEFIDDLDSIISSLVFGLLGRFAAGEIPITEILSSLDRTVFWMTAGYEAAARRD